jgi:uncharacterized protein YicC (UPF0701 family)
MNINSLNNAMLYEHLRTLNGRNLARMMATSRKYRNFIQADPRLMAKINQAKRNVTRGRIRLEVGIRRRRYVIGRLPLNQTRIDRLFHLAMLRDNHPLTRQEISGIIHTITAY